MAETYLNLMNSAAAVSAQVYDQIDRSMTQRLNVEAQAGKFEVDAMAKAAQFAETQRMNDEQIINMRAGNYLQAQKLEAEKMLMPIHLETANLQLEAQRLNLQRAKETEGKNHFNSLTSIYDDQIGYALLETQSPEMAQEYLGYKAKVSDYVAKGGKFDSSVFEKGLSDLRSKYAGVKPDPLAEVEYNPQTSYLLEQVSPKLAAEYAKRHPLVQGSRNSVANQFYHADEKGLNALTGSGILDKIFDRDKGEVGQLWIGRATVQGNYTNIERWNKDLDREKNSKSNAQSRGAAPEELDEYDKNIKQYQADIRKAMEQNNKLTQDASMGKYGIQQDLPTIAATPQGPEKQKRPLDKYNPNAQTLGVPQVKNEAFAGYQGQLSSGINKLLSASHGLQKDEKGKPIPIQTGKGSEYSKIDIGWYAQNSSGNEPDVESKKTMVDLFEQGIESMGDVEDTATPEKIKNIIGTMHRNVEIPASPFLQEMSDKYNLRLTRIKEEQATKEQFKQTGKISAENPYITFGPTSKDVFGKARINTPEQMFEAINKITNTAEKKAAMKELYAMLHSAALTNVVTDKTK